MISARATQARRAEPAADRLPGRAVPFDYAFVFTLRGNVEETQRETIRVSVEAPFTAVSIGHGVTPSFTSYPFGPRQTEDERDDDVEPEPLPVPVVLGRLRIPPRILAAAAAVDAPPLITRFGPADLRLSNIVSGLETAIRQREAIVGGSTAPLEATTFRIRPALADLLSLGDGDEELDLDEATASELFETVPVFEDVQFRYALFDEGTGREFQSAPILSTAGLGRALGERPFRYFARPIRFTPNSTVRMEVTPITPFFGQLHVVLHGYKVIGGGTSIARRASRQRRMTRRRR